MGMLRGRMGRLLRGGSRPVVRKRGQMDPADEAHLVEFLATRNIKGAV